MSSHPAEHQRARWSPRGLTAAALLRGRFTGLTIVLVTMSFAANVIPAQGLREVVVGIGFSVLVVFAVWSVGRRQRLVTVGLALPTLASHWTLLLSHSELLRALGFAIVSIFLTFLTMVILLAVFRDETVTADTIVGAVCAYFLLGMTWGTYYALVDLVSPGGFSISEGLSNAMGSTSPAAPFIPLMQYYSFTTLATLGYGDVSPLSPMARGLSVLEGITGQLYLAVLIARLVGMHTARSTR